MILKIVILNNMIYDDNKYLWRINLS